MWYELFQKKKKRELLLPSDTRERKIDIKLFERRSRKWKRNINSFLQQRFFLSRCGKLYTIKHWWTGEIWFQSIVRSIAYDEALVRVCDQADRPQGWFGHEATSSGGARMAISRGTFRRARRVAHQSLYDPEGRKEKEISGHENPRALSFITCNLFLRPLPPYPSVAVRTCRIAPGGATWVGAHVSEWVPTRAGGGGTVQQPAPDRLCVF